MVNLNGTWYRQEDVVRMGRSKSDNCKYSVYMEDGCHDGLEEFEYEGFLEVPMWYKLFPVAPESL